jgi:hypothetical protein
MSELENRVAAIEQELAEIKKTLRGNGDSKPWWERIAGTFHGSAEYQEAMQLGAEYRKSLHPDVDAKE